MTWTLVCLALLSGFSLALCAAALCLAVIVVDIKNTSVELMNVAVSQRLTAEKESASAREERVALAKAIESGSLPWFPKSEKLEARYENEALDRMENPSFYSDVVDGLGR